MKGRLPVSDQVLEASRKEVSVGLGARKERPPSFPFLKLGYQVEVGEENVCEEEGEHPGRLDICSLAKDKPGGKCHPSQGIQRQCLLRWPLGVAPT